MEKEATLMTTTDFDKRLDELKERLQATRQWFEEMKHHISCMQDMDKKSEEYQSIRHILSFYTPAQCESLCIQCPAATPERIGFLQTKLFQIYDQYVKRQATLGCKELAEKCVERLWSPEHSFQGGFGHKVYIDGREHGTHHWVLRPERLEFVRPSLIEEFALKVCKISYKIRPAAREIWGN